MKAATGEEVTAEALGGADVHTRISGVADHYAEDEAAALAQVRSIMAHAEVWRPQESAYDHKPKSNPEYEVLPGETLRHAAPEPPAYDPDELLGIIPENNNQLFDVREARHLYIVHVTSIHTMHL